MPNFNIIKKYDFDSTFRTESIVGNFDLKKENLYEKFEGNIDIENKKWNVGLIVGGSGTGKSTIAKEIFGKNYFYEYEYKSKSVIDDMPKKTINEITMAFTSVGFSSPPSWLKPYQVLSNGEKMRVDLARNLLDDKELIIFDEFTSVVNREVAKTSSYAISKAVRKNDKKFVAIACHFDVIEWLEPDWIYDTDKKEFFFFTKPIKRPSINITINRLEKNEQQNIWKIFKKYHYLNDELKQQAESYVAYINGQLVGFCAVNQFPMKKGYKVIHRLVVLPDYQGIGVGIKLLNEVSNLYTKNGWKVKIITSNPSLSNGLIRNKNWLLTNKGRSIFDPLRKVSSTRIMFSFLYKEGE